MPVNRDTKILVVDDDDQVCSLVSTYFSNFGFDVVAAYSYAAMRSQLVSDLPDLILLDLNLPDGLGFDIAREIRAEYDLPIIMLTGSQDDTDRIVGLEVGADDYVCKPFQLRELLARVRAVLRRYVSPASGSRNPAAVRFADWSLDLNARLLSHTNGRSERLTDYEYRLLKAFVDHPQRVLSRDFLLDAVGGDMSEASDRSIDYHVMKLRRKIEFDSRRPEIIKTERNAGYLFHLEPVCPN